MNGQGTSNPTVVLDEAVDAVLTTATSRLVVVRGCDDVTAAATIRHVYQRCAASEQNSGGFWPSELPHVQGALAPRQAQLGAPGGTSRAVMRFLWLGVSCDQERCAIGDAMVQVSWLFPDLQAVLERGGQARSILPELGQAAGAAAGHYVLGDEMGGQPVAALVGTLAERFPSLLGWALQALPDLVGGLGRPGERLEETARRFRQDWEARGHRRNREADLNGVSFSASSRAEDWLADEIHDLAWWGSEGGGLDRRDWRDSHLARIAQVMAEASPSLPVVIVVDRAEAMDEATGAFLVRLLAQRPTASPARALVVCLEREGTAGRTPAARDLWDRAHELAPRVIRHEVGPVPGSHGEVPRFAHLWARLDDETRWGLALASAYGPIIPQVWLAQAFKAVLGERCAEGALLSKLRASGLCFHGTFRRLVSGDDSPAVERFVFFENTADWRAILTRRDEALRELAGAQAADEGVEPGPGVVEQRMHDLSLRLDILQSLQVAEARPLRRLSPWALLSVLSSVVQRGWDGAEGLWWVAYLHLCRNLGTLVTLDQADALLARAQVDHLNRLYLMVRTRIMADFGSCERLVASWREGIAKRQSEGADQAELARLWLELARVWDRVARDYEPGGDAMTDEGETFEAAARRAYGEACAAYRAAEAELPEALRRRALLHGLFFDDAEAIETAERYLAGRAAEDEATISDEEIERLSPHGHGTIRRLLRAPDDDTLEILLRLGQWRLRADDVARAVAVLEPLLPVLTERQGPLGGWTQWCSWSLGNAYGRAGDFARARQVYETFLAGVRAGVSETNATYEMGIAQIGQAVAYWGRAEAEENSGHAAEVDQVVSPKATGTEAAGERRQWPWLCWWPMPEADLALCPQDGSAREAVAAIEAGETLIRLGDELWHVLSVEQDGADRWARLLAVHAVATAPYHGVWRAIDWEHSWLRQALATEGLDRLLPAGGRVVPRWNDNPPNTRAGRFPVPGGNRTLDGIYLLSIDEFTAELGENGLAETSPSTDQEEEVSRVWWWLRSPGGYRFTAAAVAPSGALDAVGSDVNSNLGGVRPALNFNLESGI